jgi:hypothetical protein
MRGKMPSAWTDIVSRTVTDPKTGGRSRPYQVQYRILWDDDFAASYAAGDDPVFMLQRLDCDNPKRRTVDWTVICDSRGEAETAAEEDLGAKLKWK